MEKIYYHLYLQNEETFISTGMAKFGGKDVKRGHGEPLSSM
jgi:hypothetical protein